LRTGKLLNSPHEFSIPNNENIQTYWEEGKKDAKKEYKIWILGIYI